MSSHCQAVRAVLSGCSPLARWARLAVGLAIAARAFFGHWQFVAVTGGIATARTLKNPKSFSAICSKAPLAKIFFRAQSRDLFSNGYVNELVEGNAL